MFDELLKKHNQHMLTINFTITVSRFLKRHEKLACSTNSQEMSDL